MTVRSELTAGRATGRPSCGRAHAHVKTNWSASGSFPPGVDTPKTECDKGSKASEGSRPVGRDDIQRRVDAVRAERSELENHVIDEYKAGYIGRREFLRKGAVVGMSLPMLSFLAAACGSGDKGGGSSSESGEQANQADVTDGRHHPRRAQCAGQRPRSDQGQQPGGARHAQPVGRVPHLLRPRAEADPAAGRELEAERRRLAVDVQDPRGRQVPGRQADDGGGRRRDVQPPRRSRQRLERALGLHRRAVQGRRPGHGRRRRSCSSSRRRTATSRSRRPRTTTT